MDSLAARFTFAITVAAAVPLLAAVLPALVAGRVSGAAAFFLVIGFGLIIVGVVGVAAWYLTRSLLRPLVDAIDVMNPTTAGERRASRQELSGRLPLEVRLLRAVVFGRDTTRRREASERATYVSTLIHDMKTPLLAVGRSLDLALSEGDAERRRSWLEASNGEVKRLLALVQDVVDAERLASGALHVRSEAVDLMQITHRVAERVQAVRGDVEVLVTGRSAHAHRGDPDLLERAIENVVANAVQHARKRVSVDVMTGLVRVADDGPGLPSDFEGVGLAAPRPGGSPPTAPSGRRSSGLGLFIAKRVVEAHGGRVVLESTGELGTTLLLYLGAVPTPAEVKA